MENLKTQRRRDTWRLITRCLTALLTCCLLLSSCGIYSFSGASIPAEAKTVSVQYFPNNAQLVNPLLSNTLTNALNDIFVNQTTLQSVAQNGDLALEGEITGYSTSPIAITGNQTAAMNRLTVTVNVRFTNKYDESKSFHNCNHFKIFCKINALLRIKQKTIHFFANNVKFA